MSNYKLWDTVAYKTNPYKCIGKALVKIVPNNIMIVTNDDKFIIEPESNIVAYKKEIDMSDDEIYDMLKPKMDKADVFMVKMYNSVKAIALAYRSGYLRAKKGRPFKIGGEKE
nr:MAG TPA: hypothetical protein [Caudoviricetes sp.]